MARKNVSLSHLVDTLRAFESEPITRERLLGYFRETAVDHQNVAGMDCLAGATELDIDRREVQECYPDGPVNTVDKVQTIHQVVVQGKERVVSLHVYSRPIESCVAFDLERRICYRRQLSFYSRYGQVVLNEGDVAPNPIA